jgi:predicted nuclease of predicted toxin-antitoxin system
MPRTIRFHLDEHCHRALAEGLRRRGIDVTTTPEAGLMSATDEQQLAYSSDSGRVLFTQDRDLLRLNAAGVAHAGIAYCDQDTKSIGALIQGLVLIWELLEPSEMVNRVEFL